MRQPFVYLASQSPRRRQLLEQLGVRYELLLPDAARIPNRSRRCCPARRRRLRHARHRAKLDAALARMQRRGLPPAPVLCSDTTVALGRVIYGKPMDGRDAARMLRDCRALRTAC